MNIIIGDDDKSVPVLLIPYIKNIEDHYSDIEMRTVDELETAKLLRAVGVDCIISYISCHKRYICYKKHCVCA